MGICNNFAGLLYSKVKSEKNDLPFQCVHPDVIIEDTTTLMIDMTQMLYSSCNSNLEAFRYKTVSHSTPMEFLCSGEPVGHIDFDKRTGRIQNSIEQFTIRDVVSLLTHRIRFLWKKWSFESRARGMDCKLRNIFLVLDGDSPAAKAHTKSKRLSRSTFTTLVKNMKSWMENNHCLPKNIHPLVQNLRTRFYRFEWKNVLSDNYLFGSIQRLLQSKDWKECIMEGMIESFKKIEPFPNCSVYLASGNKEHMKMPQIIKLSGNDTDDDSFLPDTIPYKEADVIIPYLWHFISKNQNGGLCIMSNDSDMIVTIFALGDERMRILTKVGSSMSRRREKKSCFFTRKDKMCLMRNMSAFAVSEKVRGISPRRMLEFLIHLTMGGSDYVEGFPKCGPVTILRGMEHFLDMSQSDLWTPIFGNLVKFLRYKDLTENEVFTRPEDVVSICVDEFAHNKDAAYIFKDVLKFIPDTFPIRIHDKIYIVQLRQDEDVSFALAWYHSQCNFSRIAKKKKQPLKPSSFISSMRRRLYYLSIICDTRLDMESIINDKIVALRCGYDRDKSYGYVDSISV